jgi:hypothetical protein
LDNGVPVLAKQTDVLLNRPVEYKAQIELFIGCFSHWPDDAYIKDNIQKSLYLIDDSGKKNIPTLGKRILQPDYCFSSWSAFIPIRLTDMEQKKFPFSESR